MPVHATREALVAARRLGVVVGIGVLLVAALWSIQLYPYWQTDRIYEELAAAGPRSRADVEAKLAGFRGAQVSEAETMQPILRERLQPDREYWRYTRYAGFPIDAVYEADGSLYALWPTYE